MCTKFHESLIKNNKVIEVWNFFYSTRLKQLGTGREAISPKRLWGIEKKFTTICTKGSSVLFKVFKHFWKKKKFFDKKFFFCFFKFFVKLKRGTKVETNLKWSGRALRWFCFFVELGRTIFSQVMSKNRFFENCA